MSIFKSCDIRGVYGKDLTDEIAFKLGRAVGSFIKGKKICVAYDSREVSRKFFKRFTKGLIASGSEVISLGMLPNPILYFYAWKKKMFGCIITASHNPKEWTGLKLVKPDGTSFVEEIKKIKKIFEEEKFTEGKGKLRRRKDAIAFYKNFLKKKFKKMKGKVVVECFGGVGVLFLKILKEFGLEVIGLHAKLDPNFYGLKRLEPKGRNLSLLKRRVKEEKADFGAAFDADGDRAVFVDDRGRELSGSEMNYIFIQDILERKKGKIILTVDCASELEDLVRKLGGKLIWWRIGHGFIEKKIKEERALFAGEQSSHFYFNEFYPFSDGTLAILYLARILSKKREKLSELVKKIKLKPVERIYLKAGNDEKKIKVIEKIKSEFPRCIRLMDGIKIKLNPEEWVLIRASQNMPEINICAEAKNKKRLREIIKKYSRLVRRKLKEIS